MDHREYAESALVAELQPDRFALERQKMVDTHLRARGIHDERLLSAMARVPRHEFVEPRYRDQAYADHPLPIGAGQTVSQPYIVALMLQVGLAGTIRHLDAAAWQEGRLRLRER